MLLLSELWPVQWPAVVVVAVAPDAVVCFAVLLLSLLLFPGVFVAVAVVGCLAIVVVTAVDLVIIVNGLWLLLCVG